MLRVYLIYAKNLFVERFDYFMVGVFIVISLVMVSVQDVVHNIPKDNWSSFFIFFISAIKNTSLVMQVFIAGFVLRALISSVRLTYKNILPRVSAIRFRY